MQGTLGGIKLTEAFTDKYTNITCIHIILYSACNGQKKKPLKFPIHKEFFPQDTVLPLERPFLLEMAF